MVIANAARPLENVRANSLGVVHGASRNSLTPLGSLGNDFQAGALDRYERRARSGANLRSAITTPPGRHGGRNNQLKNTLQNEWRSPHCTTVMRCIMLSETNPIDSRHVKDNRPRYPRIFFNVPRARVIASRRRPRPWRYRLLHSLRRRFHRVEVRRRPCSRR